MPRGPVSVITKVGGGGAPVPGGTSVTEDLTVGGGEPTLCGADSVNACAVTPGGGSEVPSGAPEASVVPGRGVEGVTLLVEVARAGCPDMEPSVGVGLDFEPEMPDTNVTKMTTKNPTIRRIIRMDLFF